MDISRIRNFCIIAHVDHGKSTLADRLLETTGPVDRRTQRAQVLDDMDLERERGITIKASAVRLHYQHTDGHEYLLNLIDTPGHVDFSFEVARSLKACEGALLVVDAAQGVEAQTVANLYQAVEHNLHIIPVLNKIDLTNAEPERVVREIVHLTGDAEAAIIHASAKSGQGVAEILSRIVEEIPPPQGDAAGPLQALVFDSSYDVYKGVIVYVRLVHGTLRPRMHVKLMTAGHEYDVLEVGVLTPAPVLVEELAAGEVGWICCNIRTPKDVVAGDTLTETGRPCRDRLPGYTRLQPMVFAGIYPANSKDFVHLREALDKLALSDASVVFEPESSDALGPGFRCGFLGLLHMEIVQERLEREYDLSLVVTSPSVIYRVVRHHGEPVLVDSPTKLPAPHEIKEIQEPHVRAVLLLPVDTMGVLMDLCTQRRGTYISTEYLSETRVKLVYELPLAEIIVDFYDKLKSCTRGYGSLDYEFIGYRAAALMKLDILLKGRACAPLSTIVPKDRAYDKGRLLAQTLKESIPRQLFEVMIQAAIGGQIIARETIKPVGKAVTAKCYGGDITRKRKLWEKQKEGKKRMKQFGNVEIPQEAFLAALKI